MFDAATELVNRLLASGTAGWNDVARQLQDALVAADNSVKLHYAIEADAIASGDGYEWQQIANEFNAKLSQARDLAQAMNFLSAGSVDIPPGLNAIPFIAAAGAWIASLSVGAALALIGGIYVLSSQAADFYYKVTGLKSTADSSPVDSLLKMLGIGVAAYVLLPMLTKKS